MSAVGRPSPHESATAHVTGRARYVDDLPTPSGLLYAWAVEAGAQCGRITRLDTSAASQMPGTVRVLTVEDIPGDPLIGPIVHDEPVLAQGEVFFPAQAVAVVLAETLEQARAAARAVVVEVEPAEAINSLGEALARKQWLITPHHIERGDVDAALEGAAHTVAGTTQNGGQDHFYLETQAAQAVPVEGGLHISSSTQHPTEVQKMAAHVLGIPASHVVCEVPRMGGGFGGKESQATNYAVLAALGAHLTGRPVRFVVDRDHDMRQTGGRHPFWTLWTAAFASDGTLTALDARLYCDGGWVTDLSGPILDRALFHLDNAYFIENVRLEGVACRTNRKSNTAFRGFGGPQGMLVIEDVMDAGARAVGLEHAEVRRRNFYGAAPRDRAPYGQQVPDDGRMSRIWSELLHSSDFAARRLIVDKANERARHARRGLAITPVKFGISFTASLLNQAGALVLVYTDGSVQLNHGGTEMGQGLYTKMRAICADALGISTDRIRHMATATDKVPNTSATAASSGSDLNGQAVLAACEEVRERMRPVAEEQVGAPAVFEDGLVVGPDGHMTFDALAGQCWARRISLASTGFYATPGVAYDREAGHGTPFYYYAYGAAVTEVEVDGLTGMHRVLRVDILHDVGDALIPSIDVGQVEGGFVQGMGWLTCEEVLFDEGGRCLTHGPSTYKIPAVGDVPRDFRVRLLDKAPQPGVIHGSKAVGEPPFMLAISVLHALRDAVSAFGDSAFDLPAPATPEAILRAVESART